MKERLAVQLIKSMSTKELKAFEKWWGSKSKGKQSHSGQLFHLLKQSKYQNWGDEDLWKKIRPKVKYSDTLMRQYYTRLFGPLIDFFRNYLIEQEEDITDIRLLEEFNRRRLPALFANLFQKVKGKIEQKESLNSDDYYLLFQLAVVRQNHEIQIPHTNDAFDLHEIKHAFDQWAILQRLIISCSLLSSRLIRSELEEDSLMPLIIPYIDSSAELLQNPLILIYRNLYSYFSEESDIDTKKIFSIVTQHKLKLPHNEIRIIFAHLINGCASRLNLYGQKKYLTELHQVYEWGIAEMLVYRNGALIPQHFRNYIGVLLRREKIKKAQQFLEEYGPHLPPDTQEAILALSQSGIYFYQGEFEKAKKVLFNRKFNRVEHEVSARFLRIQIDYEAVYDTHEWENERDTLISSVTGIIQFINRHKELPENHQAPFLNRARLFLKLLKANSKEELIALGQEIRSTYPLDQPAWLLEKVWGRLEKEYGISPPYGGDPD